MHGFANKKAGNARLPQHSLVLRWQPEAFEVSAAASIKLGKHEADGSTTLIT